MQYELEIAIAASRAVVWTALIDETNAWWLPEFRMVNPASTVEFDVTAGGRGLIEFVPDGAFLSWYAVQMFLPERFKVYLVGNLAPEWGGPSTSNLCLALDEAEDGCLLKVSDAHHGRVDANSAESLKNGWQQLFGDGLRRYVEARNRTGAQ